MEIRKYNTEQRDVWNSFITDSKNSTFLLNRDYMDYHSDRFDDHSLMFYKNDKLISLLPANLSSDNILYSHQGLSYGGLILSKKALQKDVLEIFDTIRAYLKQNGITKLIYKKIPHIYNAIPSEEDLFALFRIEATQVKCEASTAILLEEKIKFSDQRKRGAKKAKSNDISFRENTIFEEYFSIVASILESKHKTKPVHTHQEIELLKSKFPKNIRLFSSFKDNKMLAGVLVYESELVAHAQYISSSEEGKELGALDLVFDELINNIYPNKKYFNFGISSEDGGKYLNEGLISQKEGFGGRTITYNTYEILP